MSQRISTISPGLAKAFSPLSVYAKGEWVLYQNTYWQCITPILEPEAWNQSHWEPKEEAINELQHSKRAIDDRNWITPYWQYEFVGSKTSEARVHGYYVDWSQEYNGWCVFGPDGMSSGPKGTKESTYLEWSADEEWEGALLYDVTIIARYVADDTLALTSEIPLSLPPDPHASTHAAGGSDPLDPSSIGAVPSSRKVNGKDLKEDIILTASDIPYVYGEDNTVKTIIDSHSGAIGNLEESKADKVDLTTEVQRATEAEERIGSDLEGKLDKTGGTITDSLTIQNALTVNGVGVVDSLKVNSGISFGHGDSTYDGGKILGRTGDNKGANITIGTKDGTIAVLEDLEDKLGHDDVIAQSDVTNDTPIWKAASAKDLKTELDSKLDNSGNVELNGSLSVSGRLSAKNADIEGTVSANDVSISGKIIHGQATLTLPSTTGIIALKSDISPEITLDEEISPDSGNGVKSKGIWKAIWGTLTSIPDGFNSFYSWCIDQLSGKVSWANEEKNSVTIGTRVTGVTPLGEKSLEVGQEVSASGNYSIAAGIRALTRDSSGAAHHGAFCWQGESADNNDKYRSHGNGTFNINPKPADGSNDPMSGVWIGQKQLSSALSDAIDIIWCDSRDAFPRVGVENKIYVDKNANKQYRWNNVSDEWVLVGGGGSGGGGGTDENAVHYTPETKSDAEKQRARQNIGAASEVDLQSRITMSQDKEDGVWILSTTTYDTRVSDIVF